MITVTHKGNPKRISKWSWRYISGDRVRYSIDIYIDGYYQAGISQSRIDNRYDFEANLELLRALSPEVFDVKEY